MKYTFGDIVIIEDNLIGVIVKSWCKSIISKSPAHHEVYVRSYGCIKNYEESEIRRYLVRHKEIDEDEMSFQINCENS